MEEKRNILSVAELNRKARGVLENSIGEVWVEGEISRLTRHASGHWFFPLKDKTAAIDCVMFQTFNSRVDFEVHAGLQVRLFGTVSIREDNGRYQIKVSKMEEAGRGALQEQFEQLKKKLAEEGLFDRSQKKHLPRLPNKIGIVTSPTGAAVRDIINVLTRRYPNIQILLAPVLVQGGSAAKSIAKAITYLNSCNDIDLIIAGRGGGSIEDLWAFNEEVVARAIAASDIPIISAVGHEIDFTIADFVADVRAPTPSAAAELAVPVQGDLDDQVARFAARLSESLKNRALVLRERIPYLRQAMTHELKNSVTVQQQRLPRLQQSMNHTLQNAVVQQKQKLPGLQQAMTHQLQSTIAEKKQNLNRLKAQLRALSPLGVLDRGYSLTELDDGTVVRDAADVKAGDRLKTRLAKGTITSKVIK